MISELICANVWLYPSGMLWKMDGSIYPTVLLKSRIVKAITYTYARILRLKEYAQDGRILIDNNSVENALRPLAISHKNFLFCGNHTSAEQTAIICSLLGCC